MNRTPDESVARESKIQVDISAYSPVHFSLLFSFMALHNAKYDLPINLQSCIRKPSVAALLFDVWAETATVGAGP